MQLFLQLFRLLHFIHNYELLNLKLNEIIPSLCKFMFKYLYVIS